MLNGATLKFRATYSLYFKRRDFEYAKKCDSLCAMMYDQVIAVLGIKVSFRSCFVLSFHREHLGATSGAKTSVLCHCFWGRLDSFFTVALINQFECT